MVESPTVVHLKRKDGKVVQDCDVYIGRRLTMGGWNLKDSIWANPFKIDEENTREQVLEKYEKYLRSNFPLLSKLKSLEGKRIDCHGDILIKVFNEFYG